MKKSLIALAVLGAVSGAASAQSSVTMYGIVDIGVQWNETGVNVGTVAAPRFESEGVFGVGSGFQSGSRLGVRGSEALGNGWSAIFTLEAGFDVDTGMSGQGGRLWGRQAWGGLQHANLGSFVAGRVATVSSGTGSFDLWGAVDPFATGFGFFGLQGTFIASAALREDNAVLWRSPNWGGLNLGASYSFNIAGQEVGPSGNNTDAFTLGGNFTIGPVLLAATYDQINASNVATFQEDQKMLQLGAVLDLKFLKIHGAYANQANIQLVQGAINSSTLAPTGLVPYDNQAFMLGVTIPLFGGNLLGSYQMSDADEVTYGALPNRYEPDYTVWGIGYTYPFSRRTNMYIGYGQAEWDGTVTAAPVPLALSERFDRKQFALGIRHLF